jgi:hypothetical protein
LAIDQFHSVILLQAQQSAACHALHPVDARLCRWLLQSQDVIESDIIQLTRNFCLTCWACNVTPCRSPQPRCTIGI